MNKRKLFMRLLSSPEPSQLSLDVASRYFVYYEIIEEHDSAMRLAQRRKANGFYALLSTTGAGTSARSFFCVL